MRASALASFVVACVSSAWHAQLLDSRAMTQVYLWLLPERLHKAVEMLG